MRYAFIVKGPVREEVLAELPGAAAAASPTGGSVIYGPVRDDADVASWLAVLIAAGVSVVEMRPLPD